METSENSNDASLSDSFLHGQTHYVVEDSTESLNWKSGQEEDNIKDESDLPDNEPLREQDRFLPIANVAKIMKKSIPATGKIAKDAKECVQECVSEFISFITSEASDRCHQEKRKTINGEDILYAMSTLGFDNYVEPLKVYLQKYRESTKGDKMNVDSMVEELSSEDTFNAGTLTTGILTTTDQSGQQNVIYAPTYSTQISQQQIGYT